MKNLGVIANCTKPAAASILTQLNDLADQLNLNLFSDKETHDILPASTPCKILDLPGHVEVIMVLGGDGTVLGVSKQIQHNPVPLIGVNLGSLGFMTSVAQERLEEAVHALVNDEYTVSTRTTLCCRIDRKDQEPEIQTALNDVVLGWGSSARVVELELCVDGKSITKYLCDGIIVSTPTGSTGHSLSAGGPVLHPETKAFVVSAICPHTLSARPMVLPDDKELTIRLSQTHESKNLLLSIDGQQMQPFAEGDILTLTKHPQGIQFVHLNDYRYFDVLAQKLHWRGTNVPT